jgi:hypothetical protein
VSARARVVSVVLITAILIGALSYYIFGFARSRPETIVITGSDGGVTKVTLQTVAQLGYGPKTDWVSYLIQRSNGEWEHSTIFQVPAYSTIEFTILQYDGATPPRNPFWGKVIGTEGGTMSVDGKDVSFLDPEKEVGHTFTMPNFGVFVPLAAVPDNAKNQCQVAPCTEDEAHRTITFRIKTGAPGTFRFQCIIPCAAGFAQGWGGPMQTIGYMDGLMEVV